LDALNALDELVVRHKIITCMGDIDCASNVLRRIDARHHVVGRDVFGGTLVIKDAGMTSPASWKSLGAVLSQMCSVRVLDLKTTSDENERQRRAIATVSDVVRAFHATTAMDIITDVCATIMTRSSRFLFTDITAHRGWTSAASLLEFLKLTVAIPIFLLLAVASFFV